jgi:hypothetical protein
MKQRTQRWSYLALFAICTLGARQSVLEPKKTIWAEDHQTYVDLLTSGEVVEVEDVGMGVTKPHKATLAKDGKTYHAAFKPITRGRHKGYWESYQAEVAAYELDRILGLNMVPPTVVRRIEGNKGSLQYWVEETELYRDVADETPRTPAWSRQLSRMKFFDCLIHNDDRNAQNFLVDKDFTIILIDHSRGFISSDKMLKNKKKLPNAYDRKLVERMKGFTKEGLEEKLGDYLMGAQIDGILKRRDKLLQHIEKLIKEKGENAIMF